MACHHSLQSIVLQLTLMLDSSIRLYCLVAAIEMLEVQLVAIMSDEWLELKHLNSKKHHAPLIIKFPIVVVSVFRCHVQHMSAHRIDIQSLTKIV